MPDGFGNNGNSAGNTNFYFVTSVALTAGQTYYLQPVVQSGDNPWDVMAIGNTYLTGQLFASGAGFISAADLWFREGVVSVPEPTTLALIGLSGLLIFGFKRHSKLFILLCVGLLFAGMVHAQVVSIQTAGGDSVVQDVADEAGLALVPTTALPKAGTFWIVMPGNRGNLNAVPWPFLPANVPVSAVYSVTNNVFIVDASGGTALVAGNASGMMRRSAAATPASIVTMQANTVANLIGNILFPAGDANDGGMRYNGSQMTIDTNKLWLEIFNDNSSTTNLLIFIRRRCGNFPHSLIDNVAQRNFQGTGDPQQSVEVGNSHFAFNVTDGCCERPVLTPATSSKCRA